MKKFDENGNEIIDESLQDENPKVDGDEEDEDLSKLSSEQLLEKSKELISKLKATSAEAKKHRKGKAELRIQLDQYEAEAKQRKEKEMTDNGKTNELLEQTKKELESYKTKATQYDEYVEGEIEKAKELLGDDWIEEYSKLSLKSLNKLVTSFKSRKNDNNFNADDGEGKTKKKVTLSDSEKARALEMFPGVDENEAYSMFHEVQSGRKK